MHTILIAHALHQGLRAKLATIAIDHGLTQQTPWLFDAELTLYRRRQLERAIQASLRGRRGYYVSVFTLPEAHARTRFVRRC